MKSQYAAPKVFTYGGVDALTQYIGKSEADDSFVFNGQFQNADGSQGILNGGGGQ